MPREWVLFAAVKAAVSVEMLLDFYSLSDAATQKQTKKGLEFRLRCPFHDDNKPSFQWNAASGLYNCFGCDASGADILAFTAKMEGIDAGGRTEDRRRAALYLAEQFGVNSEHSSGHRRHATRPHTPPAQVVSGNAGVGECQEEPAPLAEPVEPEVINPPLGFELQSLNIEAGIEYAQSRGISQPTAEDFGLAVATKGMFKGRVVIPIHDLGAVLVGYVGRALDDADPKYLMPSQAKGFYKSYLVFNLFRILQLDSPAVIVTEGFFDCFALSQAGFPAVALMGSSLSEYQAALLGEHFQRITLFFDTDDAGRACTDECLLRLGRHRYVRAVSLPKEGMQPDQLSTDELRDALRYRSTRVMV